MKCSVCGAQVVIWQPPGSVPAQAPDPLVCTRCAYERELKKQSDDRLQEAFDNAVRRLEHDMVTPPRRPRAAIGWKSLMVGIMIGVSIAGSLQHFFGGHF